MGFNLQSGCPSEVFDADSASMVEAAFRAKYAARVRLGKPGSHMVLPGEMGWSWWKQLQQFASAKLGDPGTSYLRATDAWQAVYVDAEIDRTILWPEPKTRSGRPFGASQIVSRDRLPLLMRVKSLLGLNPIPRRIRRALDQMKRDYGPRPGEDGALQVASLRGVLREAESLLVKIGVRTDQSSVEQTLDRYERDESESDDGPAVMCLCHLWLTGSHALSHAQPLWLIK